MMDEPLSSGTARPMKEYCTLVTERVSDPFGGMLDGSRGYTHPPDEGGTTVRGDGRLQMLLRLGWAVVEATCWYSPEGLRYVFVMEREVGNEPS